MISHPKPTAGQMSSFPLGGVGPLTTGEYEHFVIVPAQIDWNLVKNTLGKDFPPREQWRPKCLIHPEGWTAHCWRGNALSSYEESLRYWSTLRNRLLERILDFSSRPDWVHECLKAIPFEREVFDQKNAVGWTFRETIVRNCSVETVSLMIDRDYLLEEDIDSEFLTHLKYHNPQSKEILKLLQNRGIYTESWGEYFKWHLGAPRRLWQQL